MTKLNARTVYLALTASSATFSSMVFTVLALYYVQVVGMNPLQLVLVGTTLEATYFLLEVPTGVVADTYSRRLSVIVGLVLIGVCYVLQGLLPLFLAILGAEVVRGIGETFLSGALEAWIADEVGDEAAGREFLRGAQVRPIGALVGTFAGIGLATIQLSLPVLLGGALLIGLGLFLALAMPEEGFHPTPRADQSSWQAMLGTFREGAGTVRRSPVILTILAIGVVFGAFSEGFDRLWEAHFLTSFQLPALASLSPIVWFAVVRAGAMLLSLGAIQIARRWVDPGSRHAVARALLAVSGALSASVVAFGLAGSFALAVGAYWLSATLRSVHDPIYTAWLSQNANPRVRATVLSMSGQADSLGQIAMGPAVGALATLTSLRLALATAGVLLSPSLLLYQRTLRRVSAASDVEEAPTPSC